MRGVSYTPLISSMTWSYSRIKAFEDCPYKWYLKYINPSPEPPRPLFFASHGGFMHGLLESYFKGEAGASELVTKYLIEFREAVAAPAPSPAVFASYFTDGLQYLKSLKPFEGEVLEVENRIEFRAKGVPYTGVIDLLIREKSGMLVLIDHKSRALKPRTTRAKPTKSDAELDEYLVQLYLYSAYIAKKYGEFPAKLCFNCFRKGRLIEQPFCESEFTKALDRLKAKTKQIARERDFAPNIEYFRCRFLCEVQDRCDYFQLSKR